MSSTNKSYRTVSPNPGAIVVIAIVVGMTWTVLVFIIRLYLRFHINGPFGLDDGASTLGMIIAAGQITATLLAVHNGLGEQEDFLLSSGQAQGLLQSIYAAALLYVLAICASKCSTSLLIARLTRTKRHLVVIHSVTGLTVVWGIVSILTIGIPAWNSVTRIENYNYNLFIRWTVIESINIMIEAMIFALSIYLVWGLKMSFKNKTIVVGAFCCRLLILLPTALRLHYLRLTLSASDRAFESVNSVLATQIVMHFSLMAATLPCMKQFLGAFDTKLGGTFAIQKSDPRRSQSQSGSYALRSALMEDIQPKQTYHVTEIAHEPHRRENAESRSVGSNSSDKAMIRKIQTWDVVYEPNK